MIRIYGDPAPQGSKSAFVRGGRAVMVESSKKVKPWRDAVAAAVLRSNTPMLSDAVIARVTFLLKRPKSHFGTRKGQPYLRPDAPVFVPTTPDLDKLLRSTFDGMTDSGMIADDRQVVIVHAQKRYCRPGEAPGALVHVEPAIAP